MVTSNLPCALCHHHEVDVIAERDRHGDPLRNVLCRSCGLIWVDPRPDPDALKAFYAEKYRSEYKGAAEPKKKHCYREMHRANERLNRLAPLYRPGDRVLDVGAGAGFFARVLVENGVDYVGVEPNAGYASFARDTLGLSGVEIGFLHDIEGKGVFDIITINHAFEHLPDPNESLARMWRLLKPDGRIIMEVPNAEADYHSPDKVFHFGHLYWYTPSTLAAMVVKNGMAVLDVELTRGTQHVNMVMCRSEEAQGAEWEHLYSGNYDSVQSFFQRRSKLRHYRSSRPYRRLASKLSGYAAERRYVKRFDNKRTLIDSIPVRKIRQE